MDRRDVADPVIQGLAVAAWIAAPDYAHSRLARAGLRCGVVAASIGARAGMDHLEAAKTANIKANNSRGGTSATRPEVGGDSRPSLVDRFGTLKGFALLGAGVSAAVAINTFGSGLTRRAAQRLEKRGVARPWTKVGLVAGVLAAAAEAAN